MFEPVKFERPDALSIAAVSNLKRRAQARLFLFWFATSPAAPRNDMLPRRCAPRNDGRKVAAFPSTVARGMMQNKQQNLSRHCEEARRADAAIQMLPPKSSPHKPQNAG